MKNETVSVELGERSYDIVVGENLLQDGGNIIAPLLRQPRVIIISDSNVAPIYNDVLVDSLVSEGIHHESLVLPAGESTKSFKYFAELVNSILALGIERSTCLVALGGGVIGDLVGYAAASVLRGIDFVQIPTSLLAQVDSSVGGKTGINTVHGKNLVGAFHQPRLVLCDVGVLDTLPERELKAGYAEVVKYGLIGDEQFFNWLECHGSDVCEGNKVSRQRAVVKSCKAKAKIVVEDEQEAGRRALLNFGHTFGHAYEAACNYTKNLNHGEAVILGIKTAVKFSFKKKYLNKATYNKIIMHIKKINFKLSVNKIFKKKDINKILGFMLNDKKNISSKINLVLLKGIGSPIINKSFHSNEIKKFFLKELINL